MDKDEVKKVAKPFLKAWMGKKYKDMYEHCALTYKVNHDLNHLKDILPNKISTYRILDVFFVTPVVADIHVRVKHEVEGSIKVRIRLMKELAPYLPTEAGEWLISPISIKRITK